MTPPPVMVLGQLKTDQRRLPLPFAMAYEGYFQPFYKTSPSRHLIASYGS